MLILFPIVLVVALALAWRKPQAAACVAVGWRWFGAWAAAGAAMTFSFLTGFSIGLFVLPPAAALTFGVARAAPGRADAIGFAAGSGAVLLVTPWPLTGLIVAVAALMTYAAVSRPSMT